MKPSVANAHQQAEAGTESGWAKERKMKLKVYADRMSQPSRAVIIFCKVNGLDFEEIEVRLAKREQYSPEFKGTICCFVNNHSLLRRAVQVPVISF